ncbi:hypothetical protein DID88_004731 [Monilinia fructigena]|uniref:Amino acid permease/ SLC12A domain-containing protein n=1 Tax=Monilinia fructigena TaxID=38457 RepID=A0A395IRG4_9HELO|nr:hypothetical protein DID88_004731 [Monilinia fructigena]
MKSESISHPATDGDTEMGSTEDVPAQKELKRDLKERHINMIAIAGMIGTGLFLSSGTTIARAGPAGAWLAYIFMGFVTAGVSYTTSEITAFMPVTGGFVRHATAFVEPALGAATGWNFWYTMAISVPAELSAAATLVQFWDSNTNPATEVIFACMKIALIIGLIIAGLVVNLGGGPKGERLGFTYWKDPGAFNEYLASGNTGRFLAFWSSLLSAAFSYGNIQVVALSGTETANPREIIPDATKKTFFRVLFFYVLSILVVGMIVPYDSESLFASKGTVASSPFVIAFRAAGIKVLPSIINAVVCTSAISSGSACIFLASRTLYGLSADGHAPKIFMKCNRFGTPLYAVGLSVLPSPLVYMVVSNKAYLVFGWFVNITTVAGLIGWVVIEVTYLRFFYSLKVQALPCKSHFQPYVAWITGSILVLIIFFSGVTAFFPGNFTASEFLTYYINIAIFIGMSSLIADMLYMLINLLAVLYAFFKFFLQSKVIPLESINFEPELDSIRQWKETSELLKEDKNLGRRIWDNVF